MDRRDLMRYRLEWVDLLRGIAMLLVIWGHVDRTNYLFFAITGPFKMPLFFAITGYVFNDRNGNLKTFFSKLVRSIVVPWVILSLVWLKLLYAVLQGKFSNIPVYVYNFISGKDLWFMPCIIIAEVFFFFVLKVTSKAQIRVLIMITIGALGIVMSEIGVGRFAMIDVACTAQLYLLFGYWFKTNELPLRKLLSVSNCLALGIVYLGLLILSMKMYPGSSIDVHTNRYYNYPLCMTMIFVSLLFLFAVAPWIKVKLNWIKFVGRNTLIFYIAHYHARSLLSHGINYVGLSIPQTFMSNVLVFAYICISMSIVSLAVNRWAPFILGRSKRTTIL